MFNILEWVVYFVEKQDVRPMFFSFCDKPDHLSSLSEF